MEEILILNAARMAVAGRLQKLGCGVNHDDYEDMVSTTILKFYTAGNFDPTIATAQTYIDRIARNVVTDYGRDHARRSERYCNIDTTNLADTLTDVWDTDTPLLVEEQERAIDWAVSKLPDRQQKLFDLLVEGHSNGEIADIMGTTANIVATEACRMRRRLKALLQDAA